MILKFFSNKKMEINKKSRSEKHFGAVSVWKKAIQRNKN